MCSTNPKTSSPNISFWSLSRTAAPLGLFYLTEVLVGLTDLAVVGALGPQPLAAALILGLMFRSAFIATRLKIVRRI